MQPATNNTGLLNFNGDIRMSQTPANPSREEEQFNSIANVSLDGIVVFNQNAVVCFCNQATASLFGFHAFDIVGNNIACLLSKSDNQEFRDDFENYLKTKEIWDLGLQKNFKGQRKDASIIFLNLTVHPVNWGSRPLFIGRIRDLSQEKRLFEQQELLHRLTVYLAQSGDLKQGCIKVLQTLSEFMSSEVAFCWTLDKENQVLRCSHSWYSTENKELYQEFVNQSLNMTFKKGSDFPGRIWEICEPYWVKDIGLDMNLSRRSQTPQDNLISGFGFPITDSSGLIGVIELFSTKVLKPDPGLANMVSSMSKQMGLFFQHYESKQGLAKDRQNFFNLLDNLPISFHLQASDYSIPYANKMFKEKFGVPRKERNCFDLIHKREEPCEVCPTFDSIESNKTIESVWTDQAGRTFLTVVTPFFNEDGAKLVMEMAVDITKEKEAEKKNQLFHQKLRKIVESCATTYDDADFFHSLVKNLATTLQVRCVFVSELVSDKRARTLALWLKNDFIDNLEYELEGTPCENISKKAIYYCPENVQEVFTKDNTLLQFGVDNYMSMPFFDAAGKPLGHLGVMCAKPLEDHETVQTILKIFAQYAGSALDRKRIADNLKASYHKLEVSNDELRDFVHIASHDLQEPLRKIISFGDLLKWSSNTLDEEGTFFLERMKNATRRLQSLLSDLVKFSTLDASVNERMDPVKLASIIQQVIIDLEILIKETNTKIEIGDLPIIDGNSFHLLRLFQNLLSNAIKYGREGVAPKIKIFDTTPAHSKYCEINIQDNGIGFDEKYIDRIFKPFQRLHRIDQFGGTGMGLAICKKIVDRHNGTITAKSVSQKGTTFTLRLPIKQTRKSKANDRH